RALAIALAAALGVGCTHSLSRPDAGSDGGGPGGDGGFDGGALPDAGPVAVRVRGVFPGHGPASGGNGALVSGSGFVEGFAARGGAAVSAQTTVKVGGALASSVDVIDDNRLQIVLPAGLGGPADVTVVNPNGSGTCAGCYRYQAPLEVSAIEPARGPS